MEIAEDSLAEILPKIPEVASLFHLPAPLPNEPTIKWSEVEL